MCSRSLIMALTSMLLLPVTTLAHVLAAPDSAEANVDGTFSVRAVLTVGPGPAIIAAHEWYGVTNIGGGIVADCFCFPGCPLEEGETFEVPAKGALTDPRAPGVLEFGVEFCNGPSLLARTRILPNPATAVEIGTWTRLRQLYR